MLSFVLFQAMNKVFGHLTEISQDLAKVQEAQRSALFIYLTLGPLSSDQDTSDTKRKIAPLKFRDLKESD